MVTNEIISTPPKLFFYPLPDLRPEPPGMATPPINIPGSVPFRWEEAPGKPKRDRSGPPLPPRPGLKHTISRALDLPPRLQAALAVEIEGPSPPVQPTRDSSLCYSVSFAEGRRGDKSSRWRSWGRKGRRRRRDESEGVSPSSSSSSSSMSSSSSGSAHHDHSHLYDACGVFGLREEEEEHAMNSVRVTIKRSKSTSVLPSHSTSHWLTNFYENLKKVIPRRKNIKA